MFIAGYAISIEKSQFNVISCLLPRLVEVSSSIRPNSEVLCVSRDALHQFMGTRVRKSQPPEVFNLGGFGGKRRARGGGVAGAAEEEGNRERKKKREQKKRRKLHVFQPSTASGGAPTKGEGGGEQKN